MLIFVAPILGTIAAGQKAFACGYWHIARVTKDCVSQSPGEREREIQTRAEHFSADWISRLEPEPKPLLLQTFSTAARQSGAPLAATAQRSRPSTTLAFGRRASVSAASLAVSTAPLAVSVAASAAPLAACTLQGRSR